MIFGRRGVSGQLKLVHGAGVRRWRRDVLTPPQDRKIQVREVCLLFG